MKIKNENVEVSFKNKTTDEVVFKTDFKPMDFDVQQQSNTSIKNQQEEDATNDNSHTVHTTDDEGVTKYFDLVGVILNPETVTLEIKNSKEKIEKLDIKKERITEKEYEVYQEIHKQLTEKK